MPATADRPDARGTSQDLSFGFYALLWLISDPERSSHLTTNREASSSPSRPRYIIKSRTVFEVRVVVRGVGGTWHHRAKSGPEDRREG